MKNILLVLAIASTMIGCSKVESELVCSTVVAKAGGLRLAEQQLVLANGQTVTVSYEEFAIYNNGDNFCKEVSFNKIK